MIDDSNFFFWLAKAVLITAGTLGMMSALTVFRYSTKKVFVVFGVYMVWVTLSSFVLLQQFGLAGIMRAFLFTISAPAIFLAYKMDRDAPTLSVFNYATQIAFSLVLNVAIVMLNTALDGAELSEMLIRIAAYALVIFLQYRFLRRPFRQLADVIKTGWGVLSLIPVSFGMLLTLVGTVPGHYMQNPVNILYIVAIMLTMLVVYFAVFQSLRRQYRVQMLIRDRDLLTVQIDAMNKQAEAVLALEEKLRILRHDIRHFTLIMEASLREGSMKRTAEILASFEETLAEAIPKAYCDDYVINSMLTTYLARAEERGIAVKVLFSGPPASVVNSTAFAVMLANALENALNACARVEQPALSLKGRVFNGQYVMELTNTCDGTVSFDRDGLPQPRRDSGHGLGTRSILAFAKQHEAMVSFQLEGNLFVLRMLISGA